MKKIFSLVTVALLGLFLLVSCGTKYTVSFDTKGGSEIEDVAVAEGKTLTLPADPTKEGAEFSGWYVDDKCREEYDATKPVIKDFTLYAKWLVTITFDSMGGSAVESVKGVFNDIVSPTGMPAPTKDGYVFMGWYRDQEYTQEQPNLFPKSSLTLYAKWGVTDASTALNFNTWIVNDKDQYSYKINEDGSHTFATVDPSLVLEKYGGEWDGLTTKTTGKDIKDMKSLTVEVEAKKGQKVLLKVNDQNSGEKWVEFTEDGKQTVKITLATDLPNLVIDEAKTALAILAGAGVNARSGEFKFTKIEFSNDAEGDALKTVNLLNSQWNDNVSYVFNLYKTTGTYSFVKTMIEHNVSKYNAISMTIVGTKDKEILLKLEGGSIESNVEKVFKMTGEEQTINWVVSEANLTKTGGEMFLWFLNPGVEGAGAEVTIKAASLVKLVDIGKDNKQATIFFNEKGGSKVADITANIGAAVTAPTAPTRNGYTFAGWFADEACTTAYTFDKMGNKSVEVYAKWDKIKYDVTFNNNEKDETPEKINVGFLPALPELEAEGFVFKGWYYDAEFSKEAKEGDAVNENTTLYAKWVERVSVEKVVDMLEDTFASNADVTVTVDQETGALTVKKEAGEWSGVSSTLKVSAIADMAYLRVTIKGTNGQKLLFKIGEVNGANSEKWVECNGEVQYYEFEFDASVLDANKTALIIMPGAGANGESDDFVITQLEFANVPAAVNMLNEFTTNTDCTATVNQETGALTVKKNSGEWAGMSSSLKISKITNMAYLRVTIKGTNGQKLLFKIGEVNGANTEKWVECNGEVQYYEFEFDASVLDVNKVALIIMPGAGTDAPSGEFVITQLEFAACASSLDIRKGWTNNDKDAYTIKETPSTITITKNAKWVNDKNEELGTEWSFVKNSIDVEDGKYTTLVIEFVGDIENQELIFNFNGKEVKPFTNGKPQTAEIILDVAITVANLQIFVNPNNVGSCNLVITNIYLK